MPDTRLKSFIDRILRCREAEDDAKEDTKAVYAELAGEGYEKAIVGQVVNFIRKREKNSDKLAEQSAKFDLYLEAYERPSHVHAREGRSGVKITPSSGDVFVDLGYTAEEGREIVARKMAERHQEQPETASQSEAPKSRPEAVANSAAHLDTPATAKDFEPGLAGPACDHDDDAANTKPATHSHSSASPSLQADAAETVPPQAVSAAQFDEDVPAFLKTDKPGCLKLKDGHCKISFPTEALCAECADKRARSLA